MRKQPDLPSKRLFFALPCEPAQRRAIAQWRNALGHLEGRPIAGENVHPTLIFLGELAVSELPGFYARCPARRVVPIPQGALSSLGAVAAGAVSGASGYSGG